MDVQVQKIVAGDADRLIVTGTVDGVAVTASGWVSHTTRYYPPEAYCPGAVSHEVAPFGGMAYREACTPGHLVAGPWPRQMTKDELLDYARTLLLERVGMSPAHTVLYDVAGTT